VRLISTLVLLFIPSALAKPPADVTQHRYGLRSKNPATPVQETQEKEQVKVGITVYSDLNYTENPAMWFNRSFNSKHGYPMDSQQTVCMTPFFKVEVTNSSDQSLKMRSSASGSSDEVIVAFDDDQGNTLTALRKDNIMDGIRTRARRFAELNAADVGADTAASVKANEEALAKVRFLTDNETILPGRTSTFHVCFDWTTMPTTRDAQGSDEAWQKTRTDVTVGIYDVPVARDAAGAVQKKTNYQFAFQVSEYKFFYTYAKKGLGWDLQKPEITKVR